MSKLEIKSLEEFILKIEELEIPIEQMFDDICGTAWNKNAKTFYDMCLDEIDVIGVVIEIEEKFDLNVWDYVVQELFEVKPDKLVAGRRRNDILGDLGIE